MDECTTLYEKHSEQNYDEQKQTSTVDSEATIAGPDTALGVVEINGPASFQTSSSQPVLDTTSVSTNGGEAEAQLVFEWQPVSCEHGHEHGGESISESSSVGHQGWNESEHSYLGGKVFAYFGKRHHADDRRGVESSVVPHIGPLSEAAWAFAAAFAEARRLG